MEDEILKIMDIFKSGKEINKVDIIRLKKRIDEMLKANISIMDKAKDYKNDAYFLCNFIKNNIETDNYMINNLLKKYERKNYEISRVKKETSLY